MAQNRAASYDASITDVMNAHRALSGGQSSGGAVSPVSGAAPQAQQKTGGGGKGGGRPDIDPNKVSESKFNTDKSYGYYGPDGKYVSAFVDMRDGGGKNQSGNYFVGGGLFSALANALKIRPAGAASARDPETDDYIVPREQIGYANVTDMFDRGGPQARGGKFQGGGGYSAAANMLYGLSGQEFGERVPYGSSVPAASAPRGGGSTAATTPTYVSAPTQDYSNLSNAPAIRSGLIGYSPQVTAGTPKPSPQDTAMTTPSMDQMWNIATQTVMRRFPTMPEAERQTAIQGEYQRLINAIGM